MFDAFAGLGVSAEPVVYSDDTVEAVRDQLLALDGALVWVNPIEQGLDRSQLDPLLREVAAAGVWMSAHPDVILRMATKQVLVDTKQMSWGTDTRLYRSTAELEASLRARLRDGAALVLKQNRGMGGDGIWKVESGGPGGDGETMLRVQHAVRESAPERLSLEAFVGRCEPYFVGAGSMVEQPFQSRLGEGLIRVYLTHDRVVGFTRQYPRGLMPPDVASRASSAKVFEPPTAPAYADLRHQMESEWAPQLQEILGLDVHDLPVIWDADFLYGERSASGADTYVLCEINASSTFAFPEHAMPTVAAAALERIRARTAAAQRDGVDRSSAR